MIIEDLENSYIQGIDKYPTSLTEAYNLLLHWKKNPKNVIDLLEPLKNEVAFINDGDIDKEEDADNNIDDGDVKNDDVTQQGEEMTEELENQALLTNVGSYKSKQGRGFRPVCFACGEPGHVMIDCPHLKEIRGKLLVNN